MDKKPKTVNSLMAYLRNEKSIDVSGSLQKKKLRYMGYYHGYKGYRYCRDSHHTFAFKKFNDLQAIYDFDMKIKTVFYPQIMFIETALKNYALECIIESTNSEKFADTFANALTSYKEFEIGSDKYKKNMQKRLSLREHIYSSISRDYKRPIVSHFYEKDEPIPIWAIFELLTLGEFGNLVSCMSKDLRKKFSKEIGIKTSADADGKLPELFIFALKDLRNAIAHNGVVFDARFKTQKINSRLSEYIGRETGISNIRFDNIIDYLLMLVFIMKGLDCSKTSMKGFVYDFEKACEQLRKQIPIGIYSQILYSDTRDKIKKVLKYISM